MIGKGSARRPGEGYEDNWERIFGKVEFAPECSEPFCNCEPGKCDRRVDEYEFDLFWYALNYRTAATNDEAETAWKELVECVNRLIERGIKE
jgi:hypothetical protein